MITPVAMRISDDAIVEQAVGLRKSGFRCVSATAGDHPGIYHFLLNIFQQPSPNEFQAQLDAPQYEPQDRLLIKRDQQIVSHLRTEYRDMQFGDISLPVGCISELGTAAQFRNRGCATVLLREAERRLARMGMSVGFLRTDQPGFYRRRGWTVCGRHSFSTAGTRDILACLSEANAVHGVPDRLPLHIRLWRHVEQEALVRLYRECTSGSYGAWLRNDVFWRWLISRRAYDQIYAAIEGTPKIDLHDSLDPIVGYAVVRDDRIVEMMISDRRRDAGAKLLGRACGDAIERDCSTMRFDAPPSDPVHNTFVAAGGRHRYIEAAGNHVFMVKLLDAKLLVRLLRRALLQRVRGAGLPLPMELGLLVDSEKYNLVFTSRGVRLKPGKLKRSYLTCSRQLFTQLLLGHCDVPQAIERDQITASTRIVAEAGGVIFPRLPLWYPSLDDLTA